MAKQDKSKLKLKDNTMPAVALIICRIYLGIYFLGQFYKLVILKDLQLID